jgi:aspartate carbamoyltransferase catalytic subunit
MIGKSLVSIIDYTKDEYLKILDLSAEFEQQPKQTILEGYVVATLFLNLQPAPV